MLSTSIFNAAPNLDVASELAEAQPHLQLFYTNRQTAVSCHASNVLGNAFPNLASAPIDEANKDKYAKCNHLFRVGVTAAFLAHSNDRPSTPTRPPSPRVLSAQLDAATESPS